MSAVTLDRVRKSLLASYGELIDMSDYDGRPESEKSAALLSRALAASYIKSETGCDDDVAARSVTDGFDDYGIDAVRFEPSSDQFFIVTSRWSGAGRSKFSVAEISKFTAGIRKLFGGDLSTFNSKFHALEGEINEALTANRQIEIVIAVVHTATQRLSGHIMRQLDEFVSEVNDPVETCRAVDVPQTGVYERITAASRDPDIELQVVLEDWGQMTHPYLAYYGRVGISQVAKWWHAHRDRLFTKNLRLYYPNSSVNSAVKKTISEDPSSFWYFNNGITLIAKEIIKGVAGSPATKFGTFTCHGASVVNGAQTIGSIGSVVSLEQIADQVDDNGFVHVRLISLDSCPPEFAMAVTRAANLQNSVGTREFAAMDPSQHRLALDFALDGRRYVYKSGDPDPPVASGCTIYEATQALGCKVSVRCAVEVKREIGQIWADTTAAPYTEIFPADLSATTLWRAVLVMRMVDQRLQKLKENSGIPRARMIGTHLNRIILHLVYRDHDIQQYLRDPESSDRLPSEVQTMTDEKFAQVCAYMNERFDNAYLASFSKNRSKCEEMAEYILHGDESGEQMLLFRRDPSQIKKFIEAACLVEVDRSDEALDIATNTLDLQTDPENK